MNIRSIYNRGYDALNYRLQLFAGGRFASYCRPTSIAFLLTDKCNARCVHCDIWKNTGPDDNPTVDQLRTCVRDLRQWLGPITVTFTGGEALMKPYTIELLDYATKLGLRTELLTNGFWADQAKIERVAMANPWRITISFDGFGKIHDKIRGRDDFYAKTSTTIRTLCDVRRRNNLTFTILLKTVIMEHNLQDLSAIAKFAAANGLVVRYQPIEQNYNTGDDAEWFLHSQNWPIDIPRAKAAVSEVVALKKQGLPIDNSIDDLQTIIRYFDDPAGLRLAVQSHLPPDQPALCSATMQLQINANGDVSICTRRSAVGSIKSLPIREIWRNRPAYWKNCCIHGETTKPGNQS